MEFRLLNKDEIECRVGTVAEKGASVLLYKTARADMNLLDEVVGPERWQRRHVLINGNLFCEIGIFCEMPDGTWEWVWKQDVGTESNTEKEKGEASDSFKRAGFNWGIGRELYTAPFIWIRNGNVKLEDYNGKKTTRDRFSVTDIQYDESGRISALEIRNDTQKCIAFTFGKTTNQAADDIVTESVKAEVITTDKMAAITKAAKDAGIPLDKILDKYGLTSIGEMTEEQFLDCVQLINKQREMLAKKKAAKKAEES